MTGFNKIICIILFLVVLVYIFALRFIKLISVISRDAKQPDLNGVSKVYRLFSYTLSVKMLSICDSEICTSLVVHIRQQFVDHQVLSCLPKCFSHFRLNN